MRPGWTTAPGLFISKQVCHWQIAWAGLHSIWEVGFLICALILTRSAPDTGNNSSNFFFDSNGGFVFPLLFTERRMRARLYASRATHLMRARNTFEKRTHAAA